MPWIHATDIITILSKGQGDGENQGSISSIFVPDHSVVRWPGALYKYGVFYLLIVIGLFIVLYFILSRIAK